MWIECRTSEFRADLSKYRRYRGLLGLPAERALVVVGSADDEHAAWLSRFHELTICSLDTFDAAFRVAAHTSAAG